MTKPSTSPLFSKSESLINLSDLEKSEIKTKISQGIVDEALLKEYTEKGFKISQEVLTKIRLEANMQIGPIKNDDVFATAKIDSQGHYSFSGPKNPLDINQGEEGKLISEHTMFPEASIGKVRYAGLSYIMQERGFFGHEGLQANAKDFFSTPEFNEFLSRKFPDTDIRESILKLFNEDNKDAKLADLLTHRAGIGDTTSHGLRLSKGSNGLNHHYTIVDLLSDNKDSKIERDATTQKPLAKQPPYGELGSSIYGNHEYSNLGYQLMGLALEYSYEKGTGVVKNYEELLSEFMLKPLSLNETKFRTSESDDRVNQSIVRMDQSGAVYVENPQNFNGALSAGGVQVSLADADKYYQEFFKGFPVGFDGKNFLYKEPREKNIFFSEDTIDKMARESLKFGPANQWSIDNQRKLQNEYDLNPDDQKERPKIPEPQYQFPGFVATMSGNKIISYSKTGETFGGKSKLMHDPESGKNIIEFEAKGANIEVLTSIIATKQLLKESGYEELSDKEKENKIQIRVGELIDAGYDFKKIDSEIKSGKEIAKIAEESKEKIEGIRKRHSVDTKFKALSVLERVDKHSSDEGRNTPFPIASISKAFCGAVCALMAADGEFGAKGIDTTLSELLEQELAKNPNSDRKEKINEYKKLLEDKGFSDVKISELLNHRSGCKDNDELAPSSWKDKTTLEFFSSNLVLDQCKRGDYNYSNNGYVLLEEIINLTSPQGSYIKEVENRIIKPLNLKNTGSLEDHNDYKSNVAKTHLAQAVFIPGAMVNPYSENVYQERTEFPANHTTPLGPVSNSCGGLYSSIDDLDRFSQELAKMFTGQSNSLTDKPVDVSKLYHDQLPKESGDSMHCSLGVEVSRYSDEEGQTIFVLKKTGLFPGNYASMEVQTSPDNSLNLKTEIALQKFDYMVTEHFTEKADKIREKTIKEFLNPLLNEKEKVEFAGKINEEVEKYLIDNGRLPKDFKDTRKEIYETFELAREQVKTYLKEKYLTDEGVIDSEKLLEKFQDTNDVDKVVKPMFDSKIEIAKGILAKSKEKIEEMKKGQENSGDGSPNPSPTASVVASQVAPLPNLIIPS